MKTREPILLCATGKKGVGKTYTTLKAIHEYIKTDKSKGKKARKVLIYDINMEYTEFKAISIADVPRFVRQSKVEVRRILPMLENGKVANLTEMLELLNDIVENFRGGMLVLEDINRYMIASKTVEVIGLLATNRHRDLDIICHFQSLSALDPRMWQNTSWVRFHYQIDDIKRYAQRIPNFELFKIAQCLVEYRYLRKGDKRFYCFVASDENFITGNFTRIDFEQACKDYIETNPKKLNETEKRFGKTINSRQKAMNQVISDLFLKYYKGI